MSRIAGIFLLGTVVSCATSVFAEDNKPQQTVSAGIPVRCWVEPAIEITRTERIPRKNAKTGVGIPPGSMMTGAVEGILGDAEKTDANADTVEVTVKVRVGFENTRLLPQQRGTRGGIVYPVAMGAKRIEEPADVPADLDAAAVEQLRNEVFRKEQELIQFLNNPKKWSVPLKAVLDAARGLEISQPIKYETYETTFHIGPAEKTNETPETGEWGGQENR